MNTVILIIGFIQAIVDAIPIISGIDDFLGIFAPGNTINDIITFGLFR